MLKILQEVERELPSLLQDRARWHTLFVDYHPPFVERVWCEWKGYRIYLHRIHPCAPGEALFHPHPWPSAMRVLSGEYEMAVGYGAGDVQPPLATTLILGVGSAYEMIDPKSWHYVRPIGGPSMSLMVTGKPWGRSSPQPEKPLRGLNSELADEILQFFRKTYRL